MPAPEASGPPDRWVAERSLRDSDLPPIAKHLLLDLLTHADAGTLVIPYRWSPSLTGLAEETSWHRRTVIRWLDFLEAEGWLARIRPTVENARKNHHRTRYTVMIPAGLVSRRDRARDSADLALVTDDPRASGNADPDLGTQGRGAGDRARLIQTVPERPDQPDLTELVIRLLSKETGVTVDAAWAAKTVELITSRPGLTNPRAYLIRILTTDPRKWLPTAQPPPFNQGERTT